MSTSRTEAGKDDAHMENINMMALRVQKVYTISRLPCLKGIGDLPGLILSKTTKLIKFNAIADYGFILENVVEPHVNSLFREFRRRAATGGRNTAVYSFDEEAADNLALGITAWSIAERANKRTAEGTFKSPGKDKGPRTGAETRTPVKNPKKEEELLCLKVPGNRIMQRQGRRKSASAGTSHEARSPASPTQAKGRASSAKPASSRTSNRQSNQNNPQKAQRASTGRARVTETPAFVRIRSSSEQSSSCLNRPSKGRRNSGVRTHPELFGAKHLQHAMRSKWVAHEFPMKFIEGTHRELAICCAQRARSKPAARACG